MLGKLQQSPGQGASLVTAIIRPELSKGKNRNCTDTLKRNQINCIGTRADFTEGLERRNAQNLGGEHTELGSGYRATKDPEGVLVSPIMAK